MRKQPTEEQKAKAAERRERFRELAKLVAGLAPEQREALAMRAGIVTIEGRSLSPFNQCLLVNQFAGVSVVGGFQQWKRAGRSVKKGARGLSLWIPTGRADKGADLDAGGEVSADGEGKSKGGAFIMGTVFDVSQTEPDDVEGMPRHTWNNCNAATGC